MQTCSKTGPPAEDDMELRDTLIAISVIARRLARKIEKEGGKTNEQNKGNISHTG
jgi:hypothetical protein